MTTPTLAEYVEQEIVGIFERVAQKVGNGELINSLSQDESAGIPMAIFVAHVALEDAWRAYLARLAERARLQKWNGNG